MLRYRNLGYTIKVRLPEECGYSGEYSVECTYMYDKEKDKYRLSMLLCREDLPDRYSISGQEIDIQYISSSRETIKEDICRIVEQASLSGFFDKYVEDFEYTCQCWDRGNEAFEIERMRNAG